MKTGVETGPWGSLSNPVLAEDELSREFKVKVIIQKKNEKRKEKKAGIQPSCFPFFPLLFSFFFILSGRP
jgi:hypothetical protein